MKVLVIGGGGREHAIVWKVAQSKLVDKIYCAPGNAGISSQAECVDIAVDDLKGLADFAKSNNIDLTIVGPELPLTLGITDEFSKHGLAVFGPSKAAAELESSKVFTKELMQKYGIPAAESEKFNSSAEAIAYLANVAYPIVIKADGLCAGKGVIIAEDEKAAKEAIIDILDNKVFGSAGKEIIVEEFLTGQELSVLALSDGENFKILPPSQDHKRIYDDDKGPNTGGMGAYSPVPFINDKDLKKIDKEILGPTIKAMKAEGREYKGILYAGLMMTSSGPKVLEYNVRFGDPETQIVLPRIKNDLVEVIMKSLRGNLSEVDIEFADEAAVCVVAAAGGYPGKYPKGLEITGLSAAAKLEGVTVFHAGTKLDSGKIVTSGGRVLGITALGENLESAINKAYEACGKINFEGMFYRKDIGKKGLSVSATNK